MGTCRRRHTTPASKCGRLGDGRGDAAGTTHAGGITAPALDPQPRMRPVVASQPDWTGAYVGASLGYRDADLTIDEDDIDPTGAIGGAFAGYQHDFGSVVPGAELDANPANFDIHPDDGVDLSLDQLHCLTVRAGYDAGRALVYGVAGAAYGSLHAEVDGAGGGDFSDWGYVIGAGTEVLVTDRVTIGG